ncbi:hypothetical protein GJ496_003901, partial [Pomphorhynchus laevis]
KFTHLVIPIADDFTANIEEILPQCNDFIHSARSQTHSNVLVHCKEGVSRSAAIVTAYVMTICEVSADVALNCVRYCRPFIAPNISFRKQLRNYEVKNSLKERNRIISVYGDLDKTDKIRCEKQAEEFEILMNSKDDDTPLGKPIPYTIPKWEENNE